MASALAGGDLAEEARAALLEAVEPLGRALAVENRLPRAGLLGGRLAAALGHRLERLAAAAAGLFARHLPRHPPAPLRLGPSMTGVGKASCLPLIAASSRESHRGVHIIFWIAFAGS